MCKSETGVCEDCYADLENDHCKIARLVGEVHGGEIPRERQKFRCGTHVADDIHNCEIFRGKLVF